MKETNNEKINGNDIQIKSKVTLWLENFWYHYKWHTVVIAFFLLVSVFSFAQCAGENTADYHIYYAGNYSLSDSEKSEIETLLQSLLTEIDKEAELGFSASSVYTEEELTKNYTYYDEEKKQDAVDWYSYNIAKSYNSDNLSNFNTYVTTGETSLWLVSPYVYESTNLKKLAVTLSESGYTGVGYDEYAVRLSDTALYQKYAVLQVLPADTLIVLTKGLVYGKTSDSSAYNVYRQLYLTMLKTEGES